MGNKKLYYIIHKPFNVLSQFRSENENPGLGTLFDLPKDVYPVGRLDLNSEGLLILTNDKSLNNRLLNPTKKHQRTYWVEVEGEPADIAIKQLRSGVDINVGGKIHHTKKAKVERLATPTVNEREPPVNEKKHPVRSWLQISLTEGKNRQVRKMTAKVGHPTLRLMRVAIEGLSLGELQPGELKQISQNVMLRKLDLL